VKEELVDEEREFIDIFLTFGKRFLRQLMDSENERILMFFKAMFKMTFLENTTSTFFIFKNHFLKLHFFINQVKRIFLIFG